MSHYPLTTERLILKRPDPVDLHQLPQWLSDPETTKYVGGVRTEDQIRTSMEKILNHWRDKRYGKFALVLKETGKIVGFCGISDVRIDGRIENDLGYLIGRAYWRRGYAFEAANAVMTDAKNHLDLKRVTAWPDDKNDASIRIVEKLGFTFEKQVSETHNNLKLNQMSLFAWVHP